MATTDRPRRELEDIATTATDMPPHASADRGFFGHPRGLSTLFFTEMWERFSYYGLRPLLVLFMAAALASGGFGFNRDQASAIVGIYAAFVYLMSLPGGWVADRLLGLRRAIFIGAVLIASGHFSIGLSGLAAPGGGKVPFFLGLVLIVLGTGLLKPNISAIVGDLYPEGGARRDAGFSIFYMGINIGAFCGQLITGFLGEQVDWHLGFGAAGVGMLAGLLIYWLTGRHALGRIGMEPTRHPDPAVQARQERTVKLAVAVGLGLIALVFVLAASGAFTIDAQSIGQNMAYVLVGMAAVFFGYVFVFGHLSSDEKKRVGVIVVLFIFAAIFWSAFEQAPTSLNLFAADFTQRVYNTSWVPAVLRRPLLILGSAGLLALLGMVTAHVLRRGPAAGLPRRALIGALAAMAAAAAVGMLGDAMAFLVLRGVAAFAFLVWLIVGVIRVGTQDLPGKVLLAFLFGSAVLLILGMVAGRDTFEVPATWFQSVNSFFIFVLAPAFAALWVTLGSRRAGDLSSPAKFALGLFFAGLGFLIMIPAANMVAGSGGARVAAWWLIGSYFLQTVGELCLSPVGLSSMTKLSPRKYVGQMMGIWFLASALGNLIGGLVGGHVDPEKLEQMPRLFVVTTASLMVAAVVLGLLVVPIRRMMATTSRAQEARAA